MYLQSSTFLNPKGDLLKNEDKISKNNMRHDVFFFSGTHFYLLLQK